MPWLFGILGLLIGAAIGEFWGAVAFAVAGALLGNWLTRQGGGRSDAQTHASTGAEELRQQVLSLTRRVAQLEAQMAALAPAEAAAAPLAPASSAAAEAAPLASPEPPLSAPSHSLAMTVAAAPAPEPVAMAAAQREVDLPQPNRLWTWLFGGNALVRIGVLVLFFGVAFLVRYAAEHVDLPIEFRLTGVAIGAIAILIVGWRLRERA